MARVRLGELLLMRGLCTREQLSEAWEQKVLYGDRLGTNLLALGILDGPDATGDAERDVEHRGDTADPRPVDRSTLRARRDVVEHELVRALVAVTLREFEDVTHDAVFLELHALDDLSVLHVQAGDDAPG
jgi:hypothetical protein